MRLEPILCLLLLSAGCLSGCATAPRGRGWGRDATPFPGWQRVGHAAERAALAPETRIPVAGALASDALVGAALGHFFGAFFNDAFLGVDGPSERGLTIEVSRQGAAAGIRWTF